LKKLDRRILMDRRSHPTDGLSRFSVRGQRGNFRRQRDRRKGGYVDRYGPGLLFLLVLISGLNILDALLTMMILNDGGWEINPLVRYIIHLYGDRFWVWKFLTVSVSLVLLCLRSQFRLVTPALFGIGAVYTGVVLFQVFLIVY